jgi:hypothetical protein
LPGCTISFQASQKNKKQPEKKTVGCLKSKRCVHAKNAEENGKFATYDVLLIKLCVLSENLCRPLQYIKKLLRQPLFMLLKIDGNIKPNYAKNHTI